jgi:hypothetical protein
MVDRKQSERYRKGPGGDPDPKDRHPVTYFLQLGPPPKVSITSQNSATITSYGGTFYIQTTAMTLTVSMSLMLKDSAGWLETKTWTSSQETQTAPSS